MSKGSKSSCLPSRQPLHERQDKTTPHNTHKTRCSLARPQLLQFHSRYYFAFVVNITITLHFICYCPEQWDFSHKPNIGIAWQECDFILNRQKQLIFICSWFVLGLTKENVDTRKKMKEISFILFLNFSF